MVDDDPDNGRRIPLVPVCAIGASAGGLTALQRLFEILPDDLGLAYVVIVHLSADHPSALGEILGQRTRMPVLQVTDGPLLRRDCVFVIAPDSELVIEGDHVTARPFSEPRSRRAPIDMFFRSVAAARGDGLAVVLSGAGADGTLGVRAVKEAGGVILVQDPGDAAFPSMPESAIGTDVADFVGTIPRLAERISEVARSKEAVRSLDVEESSNDLRRIVVFVRARTGHDFSSYKRATVMRRVLRRMQVCRTKTVAAYADHLLAHSSEARELFADLLISVTMFFRDARAFEALERAAVRPIFDELDPGSDESVRAWVIGCATGEEAYSVAILLLEEVARRKLPAQVQVFATDLDENALATARLGRYPRSIEADISEERLARFFVDDGTHYRVRKELRESVLFASHSVIKEPPFMRLDLITCRNLLIYLERSLQQQLCAIFHYALKPGRYLFLGSAETVDTAAELFAPIDRDARIYCARPHVAHSLPFPPQFVTPEGRGVAGERPRPQVERRDTPAALHATALERNAPASALVDSGQNILHLSPNAGRFILHSAGPMSNVLPTVVRPELRLDLRLALSRALDAGEPTLTHPVAVDFDGQARRVSVHVAAAPTEPHGGAQALVFFLDGGAVPDPHGASVVPDERSDEVRRLHAELRAAQEALVVSRQGHETSIQDLRATNEELQSINEEYRSTAEELETSKEELQSINEELHTVNAELKSKLASISVAHSDLQNLTAATEIGTLFLDAELRIKMSTPPIAELFNVTRADIGRPLTDFTHRLEYAHIERDARRVLRDLVPIEAEVRSGTGRWFMMRIRPYRTLDDRIDGTVLTFVDITARIEAETALRESERRYGDMFNSIDEGFCVIEVLFDEGGRPFDYRYLMVNASFEAQTGLRDVIGRTVSEMIPSHENHWFEIYGRIARTGVPERFENRAESINRWYDVYAFSMGSAARNQVGVLFKDVLARKNAEVAVRESEQRQRVLVENVPQLVWRAVADGQWTWSSPQWTSYTGLSLEASRGLGWLDAVHTEDRDRLRTLWGQADRSESLVVEFRLRNARENRFCWFQTRAAPIHNAAGDVTEWLGTCTDVDDLRSMQERQNVMVAELQHRTRNLLGVVSSICTQTLRASDTLADFEATFGDRLDALSRVQGLLSRAEDEPITLDAVIASELDALGAAGLDHVTVRGPEVRLRKRMVETFALALHELATNARKYGALANKEGRLAVTWQTGDDEVETEGRWLSLEWREEGIVPPEPSRRRPGAGGYGRQLIERALPYALQARVRYELGETALICVIDLPLVGRDGD